MVWDCYKTNQTAGKVIIKSSVKGVFYEKIIKITKIVKITEKDSGFDPVSYTAAAGIVLR
jgi:hypothetical protein